MLIMSVRVREETDPTQEFERGKFNIKNYYSEEVINHDRRERTLKSRGCRQRESSLPLGQRQSSYGRTPPRG